MGKRVTVEDDDIRERISGLVEEEKRLRAARPPNDEQLGRLREIEVRLDQCWDLLRRREAREEFGQDPGQEHVQPPSVVEHYQQ